MADVEIFLEGQDQASQEILAAERALAELDDTTKAVGSTSGEAEDQVDQLSGSVDMLSARSLAGAAALGGLVAVLGRGLAEFGEAEASAGRFERTMEQLGATSLEISQGLDTAREASWRFGGTIAENQDRIRVLSQVTGDARNGLEAFATAQDLAAAEGLSLDQAQRLVIDAMNGKTRQLERLNPRLAEQIRLTGDATQAYQLLQQQYSGAAEELRGTADDLAVLNVVKNEALITAGMLAKAWLETAATGTGFTGDVREQTTALEQAFEITRDLGSGVLRLGEYTSLIIPPIAAARAVLWSFNKDAGDVVETVSDLINKVRGLEDAATDADAPVRQLHAGIQDLTALQDEEGRALRAMFDQAVEGAKIYQAEQAAIERQREESSRRAAERRQQETAARMAHGDEILSIMAALERESQENWLASQREQLILQQEVDQARIDQQRSLMQALRESETELSSHRRILRAREREEAQLAADELAAHTQAYRMLGSAMSGVGQIGNALASSQGANRKQLAKLDVIFATGQALLLSAMSKLNPALLPGVFDAWASVATLGILAGSTAGAPQASGGGGGGGRAFGTGRRLDSAAAPVQETQPTVVVHIDNSGQTILSEDPHTQRTLADMLVRDLEAVIR